MKVIFLYDQAEKYNVKNVTKSVFKTLKPMHKITAWKTFSLFLILLRGCLNNTKKWLCYAICME